MKIRREHITILLSGVLIYVVNIAFKSVLKKQEEISVIVSAHKKIVEAGNPIVLDFKVNKEIATELLLHTSYGSTTIQPDIAGETRFTIPRFIANKKGTVSYTLFYEKGNLYQGELQIRSNTKTKVCLESYIGPPSIIAGGIDYAMQVVVPTDSYDNPLPDSTNVTIGHQFLDIEKKKELRSKDMIAWQNIFSYNSSGRILLFSKVKETISKEFSIDVFPSLPENFQIQSKRKHSYADGNQITQFITSIIKDKHGNIISDGSLVKFVIKNTKGLLLHTQANTVNGQAIAKMLHPDHEDAWQVKAYIHGMAESNSIRIEYSKVLEDFDTQFKKGNRYVTVGPLVSFMGQLIPDGAMVILKIFKENKKIDTKVETSSNGIARFFLQEGFYASGKYDVTIKALGVEKQYNNIELE
ncbi:hypothetical protein [Aquimarina muelleri]|uniref:Uncharacterized protein n=1 Tax=Aquimarina muelleri TaxID=279356 RepID=A0A918N3R6_9FLAO|nr:hypothetical protein [Aquimarina muelleri]MCX2762549.1 hypothetical protein [Aquimarina muelleri]GGX24277.1 hypothetical protein GCM10007384_26830 [Aquimarina muelleri]